ncbi:MAG: DUF4962 domain-containing protein [Kiritimatiellae bacterium]|nr:DUF4962 domain-containing protein [Kiritimatiellia bacterium]
MGRTNTLVAALALLPATWLLRPIPSAAQSIVVAPPLGHFQMRSALTNVHPRLYFTAADIPTIRTQGQGPRKWFLDDAKSAFGGYTGGSVTVTDLGDWKNYLYGFWGQFAMDMFFLVDQNTAYADTAKAWALHYARDPSFWITDDLVPMEILSGMALTYDILYDRFTASERGELRATMYQALEYIYARFFVGQYWTQDYQNNHMHNRLHGLAHASFAMYGDDPAYDVRTHADLALSCFENLLIWLPDDGSNHEGPGYWDYGHHWVVRLGHLVNHVTGTNRTAACSHFRGAHLFRIYLTAPGWRHTFNIGDGGGGAPDSVTAWARPIAEYQDAHGASVLRTFMQDYADTFYRHSAWGALWYDAGMTDEPYSNMPLSRFWPDLEVLSARSSWESNAVGFVFKCGPPGGHHMQQLRAGDAWVNVAHDHPDQNHFMLFAHGKMMAQDDDYPQPGNGAKLTRNHNSIVIDGQGGPREGEGWYQPFPYSQTATMDDVLLSGSSAYAAGNATPLYTNANRFVRHIAFVEGEYVLMIDDLVGAGGTAHEFEWRLHKDGTWTNGAPGQFFVSDGDVRLDIRFLAPAPGACTSQFLPAEATAKPCVAVSTTATQTQFVTLVVPQTNGAPAIAAEPLPATGGYAVLAQHGQTTDLFAVAPTPGTLTFTNVAAQGAAVLLRKDGSSTQAALLARGSALHVGGALLLGSDQPANLAWRLAPDGVRVEAEAPYKTSAGDVTLQVGGLTPAAWYQPVVDGAPRGPVQADSGGVAAITLNLAQRQELTLSHTAAPTSPDPPSSLRVTPAGP